MKGKTLFGVIATIGVAYLGYSVLKNKDNEIALNKKAIEKKTKNSLDLFI